MALQKVVLELGVGSMAKKIVELALRHPKTKFVGVDLQPVNYKEELRRRQTEVPSNLKIHSHTDAHEFLQGQADELFSHVYAHNTASSMSLAKRSELFAQIHRTLRQNGRLVLLESFSYGSQFEMELRNAGFTTKVKKLSPKQAVAIGNEDAEFAEKIAQAAKGATPAQMRDLPTIFYKVMSMQEKKPLSPAAHAALQRASHRVSRLLEKTPVVAITATKRKP